MLIHHFPDVLRRGERLLHAVLQTRELAHRIVTAKQKEEEREELRTVHSSGDDLALAKEEQQHNEENPDHLNRWRCGAGNGRAPQISADDPARDFREARSFTFFSAIRLDDPLIRERFL